MLLAELSPLITRDTFPRSQARTEGSQLLSQDPVNKALITFKSILVKDLGSLSGLAGGLACSTTDSNTAGAARPATQRHWCLKQSIRYVLNPKGACVSASKHIVQTIRPRLTPSFVSADQSRAIDTPAQLFHTSRYSWRLQSTTCAASVASACLDRGLSCCCSTVLLVLGAGPSSRARPAEGQHVA